MCVSEGPCGDLKVGHTAQGTQNVEGNLKRCKTMDHSLGSDQSRRWDFATAKSQRSTVHGHRRGGYLPGLIQLAVDTSPAKIARASLLARLVKHRHTVSSKCDHAGQESETKEPFAVVGD